MTEKEWLQTLNPGDQVGIEGPYKNKWISKVLRITPKGKIRLATNTLYGADGWELGGYSFQRSRLIEIGQDLRDQIERQILVEKLSKNAYLTLTLDQLRRIDSILEEAQP